MNARSNLLANVVLCSAGAKCAGKRLYTAQREGRVLRRGTDVDPGVAPIGTAQSQVPET